MQAVRGLVWVIVLVALVWLGVGIYSSTYSRNEALRLQTEQMQQMAALRQSEADKLEAQYQLAEAQAALETAKGQREVLEAAAGTVRNNSMLVSWMLLRGDALWLILTAVVCVALGFYFGTKKKQPKIIKVRADDGMYEL